MAYFQKTLNKFIYHSSSKVPEKCRGYLGGKGARLFELIDAGFSVPAFSVFTTEVHDYYLLNQTFPSELIHFINQLDPKKLYSVRSSAIGEDGNEKSFAGVFETFLNKSKEQIIKSIEQCYQSLYSERAQMYGIGVNARMAIVIQEMINPEFSGVLFSRSPIGNSALGLIECGLGLGEGVVSGQVEVDQYFYDPFFNIINKVEKEKSHQVAYDGNQTLIQLVSEAHRKRYLSEKQLMFLMESGNKLESILGVPVDVEWAIANNKIYFLQVRPITKKFQELGFYTDINLAESYPGLCSPMTASFVKKVYRKVFLETAIALGATEKKISELEPHYKDLIQYFSGHLYYHLNDYYTALTALPGGEKNLKTWHLMIGGQNLSIKYKKAIQSTLFEEVIIYTKLIRMITLQNKIFNDFIKIKSVQLNNYFEQLGLEQKGSIDSVITFLLHTIEKDQGFGLTAINDLLVMEFAKILQRKNKIYLSDLFKTNQSLESIAPLEELKQLKQKILLKPDLIKTIELYINNQSDLADLKQLEGFEYIQQYLEQYGTRCFEELKLESLNFTKDLKSFFKFLLWFQVSDKTPEKNQHQTPKTWLEKKFQDSIRIREETRFLRGKFYAFIREALFIIYEKVQSCDQRFVCFSFSDFLTLTLDDLKLIQAENYLDQWFDIINKNKGWQNLNITYPITFSHAYKEDVLPYFNEQKAMNLSSSSGDYQGIGASSGIVQGNVLILNRPQDALSYGDLKDVIIITQTTDPAWVFIMSQVKGIISERGSLLSHTAIIGRELGIPTIVALENAKLLFKNGQKIEMNGSSGIIHTFDG